MAKGNSIILTANPKGNFLEGIVYGTPLPGTVMQIKLSTEMVSGRFTWQVAAPGTDGYRPVGPQAVLLEDDLQGHDCDRAYVSGTRCRLYCPIPGDELNMRVSAVGTGTDDAVAIGDLLIVDSGTGLLIVTTGSVECEPFVCLETVSDVVATGTLVHCMFTGY